MDARRSFDHRRAMNVAASKSSAYCTRFDKPVGNNSALKVFESNRQRNHVISHVRDNLRRGYVNGIK